MDIKLTEFDRLGFYITFKITKLLKTYPYLYKSEKSLIIAALSCCVGMQVMSTQNSSYCLPLYS